MNRAGKPCAAFALLVVAVLIWLGLHRGVSGTRLRGVIVARTGEQRFSVAFSIGSLAALALLIEGFRRAPEIPLWRAPEALGWVLALLMLPAFVLLAGSVMTRNPTAVGGESALAWEPSGIFRITRHPMLCAFTIWALVHVIGRGDVSSVLFFGAFLIVAVPGMPSIDGKLARRNPSLWRQFGTHTSIVPGAAILAGRNRLVLSEIGWLVPAVGLLAWAALLWLHPILFGVSPFAPG